MANLYALYAITCFLAVLLKDNIFPKKKIITMHEVLKVKMGKEQCFNYRQSKSKKI